MTTAGSVATALTGAGHKSRLIPINRAARRDNKLTQKINTARHIVETRLLHGQWFCHRW